MRKNSLRFDLLKVIKFGGLLMLVMLIVIGNTKGAIGAQEKLKPIPEILFGTWAPSQYLNQYEMANYIAEEWEKLGLSIKVEPWTYPQPLLKNAFKEEKLFDVVIAYWSSLPARIDPNFFTYIKFHSNHPVWNAGYSNPEFDRLSEKQLETYDPEERKKIVFKLQKILFQDVPEIPVASWVQIHALNTSKFDIDYVPAHNGLRSIWNYLRISPKTEDEVFRLGKGSAQNTWNPLAVQSATDVMFMRLIYDRLIQIGTQGEPKMWVAENIETINETTFRVSIRKDLKFHDGVPLTAEDVKFSFDYLKEWKAPYFLKYLEPLQKVELVDQYALKFHLAKPFAPFIMNCLGQVFILPKHIWKDIPDKVKVKKPQEYLNVPPIGSGIYKLDYWKEGEEFKLIRNADHFMVPKVDVLVIVFGSTEIEISALKKGSIDRVWVPIQPMKAKELEKEKNIRLFRAESIGYSGPQFNCGRPPLNDKKLRQALAFAIPYERIIDDIFLGVAGKSASLIMPSNQFWHNPDMELRHFDLEKAKSLLKEAGYRWDDDGRLCYPPSE